MKLTESQLRKIIREEIDETSDIPKWKQDQMAMGITPDDEENELDFDNNKDNAVASDLDDLRKQTLELVADMEELVNGTQFGFRARAYWIPALNGILSDDPNDRAIMYNVAATIKELRAGEDN